MWVFCYNAGVVGSVEYGGCLVRLNGIEAVWGVDMRCGEWI